MVNPSSKPKRVLVTGAAGFIGFHLVMRLLAAGIKVDGVDSLDRYYDVALKQARLATIGAQTRFTFSQLDVTDYDGLRELFAEHRPDAVVHLAGQAGVRHSIVNARAYAKANLDGFLSILEACRAHPVRHLVYASSSSVYGANGKVPYHEDDPVLAPLSLYAATKRANELMAQSYAHLYGLPCSGVRFFTVYGPWGRPDMAYYGFTKAILEGRPIDVFNHGEMQRDFTYIDDAIEALVRLIERPPGTLAPGGTTPGAPHAIYNVGNHAPVTLAHFIATLETALGRKARKRYLPMQPGDVLATSADVGRLADVTGFAPHTPVEEGLARFVAWYRTYHRPETVARRTRQMPRPSSAASLTRAPAAS
ncbi:MAG TPA: NAD-dependent epimerase/dehydratase family protein [Hyphomicrobiaceae bacterium]|nr:NAD-dependent epimerase/dehydratase family protein [Hyphomicrobiaceae bacterium]